MVDERVTERVDEHGNMERVSERSTPGTTTVIERRGGSGGIITLLVLAALLVGGYFLYRMTQAEGRKDNAVAAAAKDVGQAAKDAGKAVERAADEATN